jgi:hypothetical protein
MLSAEDRQLLAFIASQRLVLGAQARLLLGGGTADADARLAPLVTAGLARRDRLHGHPDAFRITSKGLSLLLSSAPVPSPAWHRRHAIGEGWLWLAAHSGTFGSAQQVVSEREMRSLEQASSEQAGSPGDRGAEAAFTVVAPEHFGVPVRDPTSDQSHLHYPNLMLITNQGWVAVRASADRAIA